MIKLVLYCALVANIILLVSATECGCGCGGDPNAVPGCGVFCDRCSNYKEPHSCIQVCYENSCDCKKNYIYDDNTKKCVLPKDCTPTCGANEEYSDCVNGSRNCSEKGAPVKCKKGCRCKEGYLRNDDGDCIPEDECPSTSCGGDPNAQPGCGQNCGRRCSNYNKGPVACSKICQVNGCDCKKGYVYDDNLKKCVKPEDCTPTCGANEEYSDCVNGGCYGARNCSEKGAPVKCVKLAPGACKKGCRCREGYLRNDDGDCIPEDECPSTSCGGDPNAQPGCGQNCGRRCSNYNKGPVACPDICQVNGCDCKKGYVYDDNLKKCVKPEDCTPTCGANEEYSDCVNGGCYGARNCSEKGAPVKCVKLAPGACKKGCRCREGYLRNDDGDCIPEDECPSTSCGGDPNAQPGCGQNCGRRCSNYNKGPVACPRICQVNGCDCKKGYVYDDNLKKCVKPEDCTPTCGANEEYSDCVNGGCYGARNCSEKGAPVKCVKLAAGACKKGCRCKEGYLRNDDGVCIPENECPIPSTCGCGGDPNAVPGCGVFCDRCSNYKEPHSCILVCYENSCDCRKNYIYDDNTKKCVLPKDCTPTCGANEEYSDCVNGGCYGARNCSEKGASVKCVKLAPGACKKGCRCKEGYLRNDDGVCVPEDECPTPCGCGGDPNAVPGCGVFCDRCSNYKEPHSCIQVCYENSCDCKKNYIYDDNTKKCVLPKDCTPTCGANEEYSDCVNGGCYGARNCSEKGAPVKCVKLAPGACKKGCRCKEGYLRNDDGDCIPEDECPTTSCGGDPNAEPGCGQNCGRHCSNYNKGPVVCPRILCRIGACDCKEGYVYDDNLQKCVKPEDCTQTCKQNEVFTNCTNTGGPKKCSDIGRPANKKENALAICRPGCLCQDGYLRNINGICIPKSECGNSNTCGKNEYYSDCVNGGCYGPRNCSQIGGPFICVDIIEGGCIPGCLCEDGYLRDDNGVCIPEGKCPPTTNQCKANEEYDPCPAKCPPRVCGIDDRLIDCAPQPLPGDPDCPPPACRCIGGFYRNDKGDCVPWEDCPKCDKPNEVYDPCPAPCPPRRCDVDERLIRCKAPPQLGDPECQPGCRCEDGFYKNDKDICVPRDQCPLKCNGPNEHYACGGACDNVCATLDKQSQDNCPIVNIKCNDMCYCDKGYARDASGICIPIEDCPGKTPDPVQCNGPNEYYACGGACDNVCATLDKQSQDNCPIVNIKCNDMCYCDKGYARDASGICIPIEDCPGKTPDPVQCNGPNEYYACGGACDNVCATLDKQSQDNCPIVNIKCNDMCYCDKGYARDASGICIPIEDCPGKTPDPVQCNGPHEYYACGGACDNICDLLNEQSQDNCPIVNIKCNDMCYCDKGYARNDSGICIPIEDCPVKCPGPNEYYNSCANFCNPQTCDVREPIPDCIQPLYCRGACNCITGYYRNDEGVCIPEEECPAEIIYCGLNEECSTCIQAVCRNQDCASKDSPVACPSIAEGCCEEGCVCQENYYRNSSGICVSYDECPKTTCNKPHEIYSSCVYSCPPQTCENIVNKYFCPLQTPDNCKPGCICEPGYYRNKLGECISKENCLKCTGPNEYFSCGVACDNVCATLKEQSQDNCPIKNIKCSEMCYCDKGYARNASGICIPIEECPRTTPVQCNGPNEHYACGSACDNVCATLHEQSQDNCPIKNKKCNEMCYCNKGYARDASGICIPIEDCPGKTPDPVQCNGPHEHYECGGACDNVCDLLNEQSQDKCPIVNIKCNDRCYCDKGYARNDSGICIPIEDCPVKCPGPNEYYNSCADFCNPQTCDVREPKPDCVQPLYCRGACNCITGYYRNAEGVCIPEKECPKTCPENENYNTCPPQKCDAEYCPKSRDSPVACKSTKNCGEPRCTCNFNHKRNRKTGKCVPIRDCPPFKCDKPNEEYQGCPPPCPGEKCSDYINNTSCPKTRIGIVVPCQPQCRCRKGYYRNEKNICIKGSECKKECVTTTVAPECDNNNNNNNGGNTSSTEVQKRFTQGVTSFSINFLKELIKEKSGKSVFSSPFSLHVLLGELLLYSENECLKELLSVFNLANKDEVRTAYEAVTRDETSTQSNVTYELATKSYFPKEYALSPAFLKDTKEVFNAIAESIDMSDNAAAADYINKWVEDVTRGYIKNLIAKEAIDAMTRLILVNAIFFKGDWKYQFNPNQTYDQEFYITKDKTTQIPMMYQMKDFNYAESSDLQAQVIQLPYTDENFSLICLLPLEKDGLQGTLDRLNENTFTDAVNSLVKTKVRLSFPKAKIETSTGLTSILKNLGVTKIFDSSDSGLTGITEKNEVLYVSNAIQKAFFECDENGSTAAAATGLVVGTTSVVTPKEPSFVADHPFVFCIKHKDLVLFIGVFTNVE